MHRQASLLHDFAIESTLSGRTYAQNITSWKILGYHVKIVFLRLPSPEMAIRRVRQRVTQGGHDVPELVIRRRYERGWDNFVRVYRGLVHSWQVYDASQWPPILMDEGGQS